jgi:hypothetical protein
MTIERKENCMAIDQYTTGDYLEKNPTWHVGESPWKAREIRRMLARNHLVPNSICEVGCGAAEILKRLQEEMGSNCIFSGYEISPQAFALAKQRENERLHVYLRDIASEQNVFFNLILVMDVLEHVEDYFTLLRTIHPKSEYKILQIPMDLSVRSVLWGHLTTYREAYGHIHYFTKELALQMLKEVGYEVLDYFYTSEVIEDPPNLIKRSSLVRLRKRLGKTKISALKLPGNIAFLLHQDMAVRIWGQWRLLVLAK